MKAEAVASPGAHPLARPLPPLPHTRQSTMSRTAVVCVGTSPLLPLPSPGIQTPWPPQAATECRAPRPYQGAPPTQLEERPKQKLEVGIYAHTGRDRILE